MRITIIGLLTTLLFGCAYHSSTILKADASYLQFAGNVGGVTVVIDDTSFELSTEKNPLYQIENGKHYVKIYRNNEIIIDRVIFLADKETMEILIP